MTPCEKLGYKVGDRFEVITNDTSDSSEIGDVVRLSCDDGTSAPFFFNETKKKAEVVCGVKSLKFIRPQSESEKRGAKFGTMGVVKETGKRCVFIDESLVIPGYWEIDVEGEESRRHRKPSAIRLDHEPEYKEIPFSEATHEQRMVVKNLRLKIDEEILSIQISHCEGFYSITLGDGTVVLFYEDGSPILFREDSRDDDFTLTVRVPS